MKKRKLLVATLVFLMCFGMTITAFGASGIVNNGDFNISHGPEGGVRPIGDFTVNNQVAFCIDHEKIGPPTGTTYVEMVYNNQKMRKILYYGYDGPAQWSGLGSRQEAIATTSLMLSEIYASEPNKYDYYPPIKRFKAFLATAPEVPNNTIKFLKPSLTAYYDVNTKEQRTATTEVVGAPGAKLTIPLGDGIILVNITKNKSSVGSAVLEAGDKYYYKAALNVSVNSNYATGAVGKNWEWQPVVFRTTGDWQNLGRLDKITDPAAITSQSVKFLDFGSLKIAKIEADGDLIDGSKFNLKSTSYEGWDEDYLIVNGELEINNLPAGTYTLTELEAPSGYVRDPIVMDITINKDIITEKTVINKQAEFLKENFEGKLLEGCEFEVTDNETGEIVDSGITNKDTPVILKNLVVGKEYTLTELEAPEGYVISMPVVFTVTEDKETQKVNMVDKQVKFIKENPFGLNLSGGRFEIREKIEKGLIDISDNKEISLETKIGPKKEAATGELLFSFTAKKEGNILPNLQEGKTYILTELEAPSGYEIGKPVEFTVTENKKVQIVTMTNDFIIGTLDMKDIANLERLNINTGDSSLLLVAVFLLLAGAGTIAFLFTKKKRNRKGEK